jgi:hypothetical protein
MSNLPATAVGNVDRLVFRHATLQNVKHGIEACWRHRAAGR